MHPILPRARRPARRRLTASRLGSLALLPAILTLAACADGATAPERGAAASLVLDEDVITVASLGDTVRLAALVLDAAGRELDGIPVEWSTPDPHLLEPLGEGAFRSVGNGGATVLARVASGHRAPDVSAKALERSASVAIRQEAASIRLDGVSGGPDAPLVLWAVGEVLAPEVEVRDAQGSRIDADVPLDWSAHDESVLALGPDGRLTATGHGTTTLRVSSGPARASATIEVRARLARPVCVSFTEEGGDAGEGCGTLELTFTAGG